MRLAIFSTFLLMMVFVLGGSHAYVWWRLVYQLAWPRPVFWSLSILFACGVLTGPVGMPITRMLPPDQARVMALVVFTWLGSFFLLLCLTAAVDLGLLGARGVLWLAHQHPPELESAERRLWLMRVLRGMSLMVLAGGIWRSRQEVKDGPRIERVTVGLARLPKACDGITIAQISDLHVAPLLDRSYVEQVVDKTMALHADVIVLTGDLIDGSVTALRDHVAPLARLKARYGVYFCTGNHEYYSDADAWLAFLPTLGIRTLRNERVVIGEGADSFDLAGIDDLTAAKFGPGHGADLPKALAGRDVTRELVLLAHQPKVAYEARDHGVGLMLSGHTHGGQLWPFGYIVLLVQPFLRGLHAMGQTQVYVNRGTGYWGPPMRLGSTPEITLLTLKTQR